MPVLNSAPTPPRVTLERREAGVYAVLRDGARLAGPVLLIADYVGWRFHVGVVDESWSHRTFRSALAWLATDDGRAWVAALPAAEDPS